ncbi:MAG: hypothetical protein JW742_00955 [Candidatus Aminicenantes bacterium]|nr:hypothetical protein [Candidatus Aminicenantes bacterium]
MTAPPPPGIVKRTAFELVLDERKILTRIGHKGPARSVRPSLALAVREERERAFRLVEPAAIWRVLEAGETNGHPVFAGATRVAFAVCTIGPRLEEAVAGLIGTDVLRGLILDALGSQAVSEISREIVRDMEGRARAMGLTPSRRFAPGYRSWPVEAQAFLFKCLPGDLIGVRLTDSYMMVPRKSYSFRVNFFPPSGPGPD